MAINWIKTVSIVGGALGAGASIISALTSGKVQDEKIREATEKAVKAALEAKEGS